MSLKDIGNLVNVIKQLNSLNQNQRNITNPVYDKIVKSFNGETSSEELIQKLQKYKLSEDAIEDVVRDIGKSTSNKHFNENDAFESIQTWKDSIKNTSAKKQIHLTFPKSLPKLKLQKKLFQILDKLILIM